MDTLHIWNNLTAADEATAWVESHLEASRNKIAELLAVPVTENAQRTVANTLKPYDEALWHLRMAGSQSGVMFMVHPQSEVRDAAQACSASISAEATSLSLNRDVYQALSAIDLTHEDAATTYYIDRALLGYRLSGVDKDEPTREKIRALAERMTELSMSFSRTVQDDVRTLETSAEDLRGLPDDYLTRHGVQQINNTLVSDTPVILTTDPPEMSPVMTYAASRALRRKMYLAYNDRGYPANKQVLLDLLAAREEMAHLLGFRSWADLATVDQMMGSAENMRTFLAGVEAAARDMAQREYTDLIAFVEQQDPTALPLTLSDARFWEEQFRRAHYDFDSQSVRPYFPYEQVEAGVLAAAARLFNVQFLRNAAVPTWASGVKAFDVFDAPPESNCHPDPELAEGEGPAAVAKDCHPERSEGPDVAKDCHPERSEGPASAPAHAHASLEPLGRIYLDMHPREGKSKWFSECSLVGGILNAHLPEASLVCNFPQPSANDPGLMQFSDVVTCFHEFGHLMHEVLGGRQRWSAQSGITTEGDFVEVPSQMLEEFFEDPELLRTFARHYQTGEPIPYDTVAKMTRAAAHGRALSTLTQVMYATYSLETHDRAAANLDLDHLLREGYDRFSRYEFVDGNRMYAAFTHLVGYTSNYYTYLYDKVIALEFFTEFKATTGNPNAETATATALRYRQTVLEPGGSRPAQELVQSFLGREVSMNALRSWITREFS